VTPLAVTVTAKKPGRYLNEAKLKAAEWGLPFFDRVEKSPLEPMLEAHAKAFLVLGGEGWTLQDAESALTFTPGMARVRIKRIALGQQEDDVIVRLCELKAGDTVFDGTLGLAGDSLVCEYKVGATGRVIGVEASLAVFALVSSGLARLGSTIDVRHGTAIEVLRSMPDASVDCVIVDPMFDRPKKASPAFELLRRFAVHEPLSLETLEEARRVARRWVVVKGGRYGREFARLGLTPLAMPRSAALMWARLPPLR
jgi:16S rRNA (guanine1516-N2)-methyltransferase